MQIESRGKRKTKFSRLALPRCRLSYPKIVQRKTKFSRLALPRCRLSYPKIVQIESRDKWKTKFSRLALPRCRLSSAKKCKSRAVQKNGCLKCTAEVTEKTFCRIGPGSYRPVRVSSLQIDKYRLAIRRFRSCYLLYNRFPGKNIEINSAFKKKIRV